MVLIQEKSNNDANVTLCTGAILSSEYVISAAHCFHDRDLRRIQIVIGIDHLKNIKSALFRDIVKVHVMPDHIVGQFYFDVAIIQVQFIDASHFRPICLPKQADESSGEKRVQRTVTFAGWGHAAKSEPSSKLVATNLTVYSQLRCNETHSSANLQNLVNPKLPRRFQKSVLCADYEGGGRGICNGDSGGPLFVKDYISGGGFQATLVGIATGVIGGTCGDHKIPDVFNRIEASETLTWVKQVVFKPGENILPFRLKL